MLFCLTANRDKHFTPNIQLSFEKLAYYFHIWLLGSRTHSCDLKRQQQIEKKTSHKNAGT